MRFARLTPFFLAAFCTLPLAAQQPDAPQPQTQPQAQPQPDTQASPSAQQPSQTVPAAAPAELQLAPVTAELTTKLDSKTAKAGDSVVLKTTEKATMADGTVIPKGSKIMGHVTEAQAYAANSDNGRVTLQFDQAEIKSGQTVPIKSAIQTISPANGSGADTDSGMPAASSGSPVPSGSAPGGGSPSTSGGSSARTVPAAPTGSPGGSADQPQAAGSPSGPAPGTTVARNGNVVIKTSSVPGVLVASSVSGQPFSNASGALLSARQDVKLDGGTKMVLALAAAPSGSTAR
jgi:hypothetical protein